MSTFDAEANAAEWNSRYSESDRMWSGNPNGALVDIAKHIAPGRALDVGCGEGADAVWLASHGWQVTAIDPSSVALERARAHGANTSVAWINSGIQEFAARERAESFDLVSAMYPVIEAPDPDTGVEYLTELVAPGGHLLFVHHVVDPTPSTCASIRSLPTCCPSTLCATTSPRTRTNGASRWQRIVRAQSRQAGVPVTPQTA